MAKTNSQKRIEEQFGTTFKKSTVADGYIFLASTGAEKYPDTEEESQIRAPHFIAMNASSKEWEYVRNKGLSIGCLQRTTERGCGWDSLFDAVESRAKTDRLLATIGA